MESILTKEKTDSNKELYIISEATSGLSGEELFPNLVKSIALTFHAKYAFIALVDGEKKEGMRTLALCIDGQTVDNISYKLQDTPCTNVYSQSACFYSENITNLFPKDFLLQEMHAESYLGVPIFSPKNEPLGILVVIDDKPMKENPNWVQILNIFANRIGIELERIQFEEQLTIKNIELSLYNERLRQYGYMVSHNLRSPLANIIGLIELVQLKEGITDAQITENIKKSALKLDDVVKDLNKILELNDSSMKQFEEIDLQELLHIVMDVLKRDIKDANAQICYEFERPKIYSIKSYIYNIFYNLISNSIKYKQQNTRPIIQIKTEINSSNTIFTFTDNGMGIDLVQYGERLFKINQRFHSDIEGKGLGLFMVKKQVELLNGEIQIESIINKGTTFIISLPTNSQ